MKATRFERLITRAKLCLRGRAVGEQQPCSIRGLFRSLFSLFSLWLVVCCVGQIRCSLSSSVFCLPTSVLVVVGNAFRIRRVSRKVEIIVLDDTHHRPPMIGNRFRVSCASLFTARLCSFRLAEVCLWRIVAFRGEQTGRAD